MEKYFHPTAVATSMKLDRVDALPAVCEQPVPNTPQGNFDVFWQSFKEHYPFFTMKNVDWDDVRKKYRPADDAEMTEAELFQLFVDMIKPLGDAHTGIKSDSMKKLYLGNRPDMTPITEQKTARKEEIIEGEYTPSGLRRLCNDKIKFGFLKSGVRYVNIDEFMDISPEKEYAKEVSCMEKALDEFLSAASPLSALVIDVRTNEGGYDPLAIAVARRLTRDTYLAYSKQARVGNTDEVMWSEAQPVWVRPASDKPGFFGQVILLTGPDSVSAAETFTMAVMNRRPEVVRIGANTQGVFSDTLMRGLPNGWRFALPNEQFLTEDGLTYDGPGIPPHIFVPVFPESDLKSGRDSALEKALEVIAESAMP